MKRFEASASINAAADKVFALVADFNRHGEWSGHHLQVTQQGSGEATVGTRFSTIAKQFGTQAEESTITDLAPPSAFGWDSVGALGRVHHGFTLSENGGSTTVTKFAEMAEPSFLAKVMMWKISMDSPKALRNDLAKIKDLVEGQARP